MSKLNRLFAGAAASACLLGALGCQASYSADVTNKTPAPVFVQIVSRSSAGAVPDAGKRLGPGDRAFIGPIRNDRGRGAYLVVDTLPNPSRPTTIELLADATSYLEVRSDSNQVGGPFVVIQK